MQKIPFVDLRQQYESIKTDIDNVMASVMLDTAFVGGSNNKYVTQFESQFADYLGVKQVVSCANGTDSIEILLEAMGVKAGDEVIVPALSWISTSEAVGRIGATPVFVDVCEDTLLIDTGKIEQKITSKTKVIIPVHLYGNAVDMETIMRIAKASGLKVIEDCAQSHGARYNGKLVGTFGDAASFSFYPGKNLGAYGDAGCITTDFSELANKCRMIANHGQIKKHDHVMEGRNSRMDGLHGAVLSVKLKRLDEWNTKRQNNAAYYDLILPAEKFRKPTINKGASHVYHLYVIRTEKRDDLKDYLGKKGIETAVHYPTALPFLKAYSHYGYKPYDFPVAYAETQKVLSIPMFPELTREQMDSVVTAIISFK